MTKKASRQDLLSRMQEDGQGLIFVSNKSEYPANPDDEDVEKTDQPRSIELTNHPSSPGFSPVVFSGSHIGQGNPVHNER